LECFIIQLIEEFKIACLYFAYLKHISSKYKFFF